MCSGLILIIGSRLKKTTTKKTGFSNNILGGKLFNETYFNPYGKGWSKDWSDNSGNCRSPSFLNSLQRISEIKDSTIVHTLVETD